MQAFKNIRNYLFAQITDEIHKHKTADLDKSKDGAGGASIGDQETSQQALTRNKLYLYLFHLFESVVNNVA